jgi:insertion element IS1 protein InsB
MHTYIGSKKSIAGYGVLLIETQKDSSSRPAVTVQKLWSAIKACATGKGMTDYWKAYKELLPPAQHLPSKAETLTVKGYNRLFRYFLARLRRKSKCYSTSLMMLEYSVKLLMLKWNKALYILN